MSLKLNLLLARKYLFYITKLIIKYLKTKVENKYLLFTEDLISHNSIFISFLYVILKI
jgi:hypothetical protein